MKLIVKTLILVIRFYQVFISSLLGNRCRFYPSCSQYFIDALKYKGLFKGTMIGLMRILRCNPFNNGGYDPIKE